MSPLFGNQINFSKLSLMSLTEVTFSCIKLVHQELSLLVYQAVVTSLDCGSHGDLKQLSIKIYLFWFIRQLRIHWTLVVMVI